jgi:hypothetical protein
MIVKRINISKIQNYLRIDMRKELLNEYVYWE